MHFLPVSGFTSEKAHWNLLSVFRVVYVRDFLIRDALLTIHQTSFFIRVLCFQVWLIWDWNSLFPKPVTVCPLWPPWLYPMVWTGRLSLLMPWIRKYKCKIRHVDTYIPWLRCVMQSFHWSMKGFKTTTRYHLSLQWPVILLRGCLETAYYMHTCESIWRVEKGNFHNSVRPVDCRYKR